MTRPVPYKLLVTIAVAAALLAAAFSALRGNNDPTADGGLSAVDQAWLARRLARPAMPAPKPGQPEVLLLWRTRQDADKVKDYIALVDHPEGLQGVYGMDVASSDALAIKIHFQELMASRPVPGAWLVVLDKFGHPLVSTPLLSKKNIENAFRKASGQSVQLDGASDAYLDLPAPDFTTKTQDGKPFTLSALKGKRVILTFYCGCNYCEAMASALGALQHDPRYQDIQWYSVTHMSPNRAFVFMKAQGQHFTALNEIPESIAHEYDSLVCPRVWYIAPDGKVRYY
ncbi:MAG: peroxiredoxin family protein, partial [Chloroflexi bacterium]|nr:peroxiredoxin family protein [Chloroflexota bacterium]